MGAKSNNSHKLTEGGLLRAKESHKLTDKEKDGYWCYTDKPPAYACGLPVSVEWHSLSPLVSQPLGVSPRHCM